MKKIIAVDFDGVIHDFKNPIIGRKMGDPILGAKESLEKLKTKGYHIIIFTVWGGTRQGEKTISDWMSYYGIPFHEITNIKPNADYYIDDKAISFENWSDTNKKIYGA